ncbi:MAG: FecR domain-containing protein, partial [Chloroflexi bacterium]|nr:FecR domain-containing protein [Chloroflexota bacterium]
MSYEEPESNNLMSNPRLLTAIIVGAIGLVSIVGCVAIFFIFGTRNQPPTQGTKVIQVTKIPTSTVTLTSVPSATKQPTLDPNKASGGGGGETPTPDLTATFINRPQTRAATISEIKGSVQIKSPIGGDFTTVTTNVTIPAGTIILTSEDSSAKITLTEGSIIRVGPQTQVKIDQLGGTTQNPVTKLKLDFGKVWSIVGGSLGTGSFDVETPLGTASVIGSFMGTETNPTEELDIITCLEGLCKYFNAKGVQTLTTLQQLIVKKDTALSAPTKMDTVQVNDWSP